MHCVICDKNLKDHESVRRHGITGEFLDICDWCLRTIPGMPTKMPKEMPTASEDDIGEIDIDFDIDVTKVTDIYNDDVDND